MFRMMKMRKVLTVNRKLVNQISKSSKKQHYEKDRINI